MHARASLWAVAAALLAAAPARAADVTFISATQTTAGSTRTMRIPRSGTVNVPAMASGLLVVAVGINNIDYQVDTVTWSVTDASGATVQAQAFQVAVTKEVTGPTCRTELWALARPASGPGYVTVTAKGSGTPMPSMGGSLLAFANVASTSTDGPCCVNASNSGTGTSTINKTMSDTSRGDALVNAVCTSWSGGAVAGTPGPDPANDPEMVPRTLQTISNMQHFTGTSPGGEADAPATSYRHLRWLQTGSRSWAIAGLSLHATPVPPPPPPPPDAAPPPPDTAPPPDAAAPAQDTGLTPPPDAAALADAALPMDSAVQPDQPRGPPVLAVPAPDVGVIDRAPDADLVQRQVSLQVGCACQLGGRARGGLGLLLVLAPLLRRREDRRARRNDR